MRKLSDHWLRLKYWLHAPIVLPMFPWLYAQAMRIKRTMPDLPDAPGDQFGLYSGHAPTIRMVALGESTVAGVGSANQREALTGQIAKAISQTTNRSVYFEAIGQTGIQVQELISQLVPKLPTEPVDLIFIAMGGNDTFKLNRPHQWRKSFWRLLTTIREKQADAYIVILNLPTVWQFDGFTPLMKWVMGRLVRMHAGAIKDLPVHCDRVKFMKYPIDLTKWKAHLPEGSGMEYFFADGVHPSPITCQLWGIEVVKYLVDEGIFAAEGQGADAEG